MAATPEKNPKHWDVKLSHKVRHTVVTVLITLFIIGGGAYGYYYFSQDTQASISPVTPAARVSTVESATSTNIRFDEAAFYFMLPADWKKTGELTTGPHRKFSYQSTMKNADNRYLDVYMDALPLDMAVNKVVAVRSEGTKMTHGMVSNNCTEFTTKATPTTYKALAKWDGVDFYCDTESPARNVVGTSSPGSINKVELSSIGFTKHSFFFVYTDHNFTPEYTIFYQMLDSFGVK